MRKTKQQRVTTNEEQRNGQEVHSEQRPDARHERRGKRRERRDSDEINYTRTTRGRGRKRRVHANDGLYPIPCLRRFSMRSIKKKKLDHTFRP